MTRGARGRKTGKRARNETSAGGVVFRVVGGQPVFLLIRDSYGHWGFPKGHLEPGERADTAALRETMEETGLRSLTLHGLIDDIDWYFRFDGTLIHKRCKFYLMEATTSETNPQQSEGITACRWLPGEAAQELLVYENAKAVLAHAHEMVLSRAGARSA